MHVEEESNLSESTKGFSYVFFILAALFITCLLVSNIVAGKLFTVNNWVLPAGVILFPLTYVFGNILTEVYGFRHSRLVIWTGFGCSALMAFVFYIVILLPYPGFWGGQDAYATVLGMTPRLVFASLVAYFFGEFFNAAVLSKMKLLTKGRWLWTRTIGSTAVGQGVDTILFIFIAFAGIIPSAVLVQMMIVQYLWKVGYEVVVTPATYAIVNWLKRKERLDAYDHGVHYSPFSLKV